MEFKIMQSKLTDWIVFVVITAPSNVALAILDMTRYKIIYWETVTMNKCTNRDIFRV